MARSRKSRIQGVAILVIFLALAAAGIMSLRSRDSGPSFDYKDSNKQFENAGSLNKAEVVVNCLNIGKALDEMSSIVNTYSIGKPLRKDRLGHYGKYIFQVELDRFPEILQKLKPLGNIAQQSELVDSTLINKRVATEEQVLASKRIELARLEQESSYYGGDLDNKNTRIAEIRRLENTIDLLKNSDKTLLYVKLQTSFSGNSLSTVKDFVRNFAMFLVGFFVLVIVAYYGTKLVMYLLSLMGFKGFSMSNFGGSYQYGNYGNYANRYYSSRYGYRNSKRKVKRIYKDKPTTPREEDESGK